MSDSNHVDLELNDRSYAALAREAERLGLSESQVVFRATAAWLNEMADNSATPQSAQSES